MVLYLLKQKPPIEMTNEEIIEELYWSAHRANVFPQFREEIHQQLKSNPSIKMIDAAEDVYRRFRKEGLIPTGRDVNHHRVSELPK